MKQIFSFITDILIIPLCLTLLSGCGNTNVNTQNTSDASGSVLPTSGNSNSSNSVISASEDLSDSGSSADLPVFSQDLLSFPDAPSSRELAVMMGNGINLGNTMEACNSNDFTTTYPISQYETMWGQPVTTQEMIHSMWENGFDTIRIPVAWTNTMDFLHGDYAIREEQLARVKEIIDYAYADDMYVIINDHWDKGWWGLFGDRDLSVREDAMTMYVQMWTQISEYFRDYDEHLIFEGGNEEIGDRLNDIGSFNPGGGALSEDECYATANMINQAFVDTVRSSGGNNTGRFLLIPGYNTDIIRTLDGRWTMPEDPAPDRLLLSVHYYTPWFYCGAGAMSWGTEDETAEMDRLMEALNVYGKDLGIVIGEYGVLPTSDLTLKPDALLWYNQFRINCDRYGYASCLWDRGDFLNKSTHQWIDPELEDYYRRGNVNE